MSEETNEGPQFEAVTGNSPADFLGNVALKILEAGTRFIIIAIPKDVTAGGSVDCASNIKPEHLGEYLRRIADVLDLGQEEEVGGLDN